MTNHLTEEELRPLEALHAKATPGDWVDNVGAVVADGRYQACCGRGSNECCGNPEVFGDVSDVADRCSAEDAAFISEAKNSFPRLLATIRALQERVDKAEAERDDAKDELSALSSFVGAGLGDDDTTVEQFAKRIRWGVENMIKSVTTRAEAAEAEVVRLREVAVDATKALPVLKTMLEVAGLAAGAIVAEGMLAHARKALGGDNDQ